MILLRNNIVLNVRVQEAEARAADAERRLAAALEHLANASQPETAPPEPPQVLTGVASPVATDETDAASEATGDAVPASQENDVGQADPPAPPPLPHRIVGMVESPGRLPDVITDGVLDVSGWALTESGDATIEAIVDGRSCGLIVTAIHVLTRRTSIRVFRLGIAALSPAKFRWPIFLTACTM